MIAVMNNTGRRLSAGDLRDMESRLEISLPNGYSKFLLQYNGGRPVPNAFPIEGLAANPFGVIQVFLGIDRPIVSSNIEWNYELFVGDGVGDLLPIACTGCGDLICLFLSGEHAGAIVFWDAHGNKEKSQAEKVFSIAPSFKEFLEAIVEYPVGH